MVEKRASQIQGGFFPYPDSRRIRALTIFLGYTSNLVTSGLREVSGFVYLTN